MATRDTRLLKNQMDILSGLPKEYVFLNYLRCHDDIGWGLDYDTLNGGAWRSVLINSTSMISSLERLRTATAVESFTMQIP